MFWLFVLLGFVTFVVSGELTVEPINLVAVVGGDAVLSCRTRSAGPLSWRRRVVGNSLYSNSIAAEGRPRTAASVDHDGRRRLDVVLEPVQLGDAGHYQCLGDGAARANSQLVVLDAVPNCTAELFGDLDLTAGGHLSMRCAFSRWPNFETNMPWFDPAGHEFLRRHFSAAVGPTALRQHLLVARLRATDDNDDRTKLFDLSFVANQPEPGHVFNWSAANVVVLMSVRNIRIRLNSSQSSNCCSSGEENVLYIGDELLCEADGQPNVAYRWQEVLEPLQNYPEGRRLSLARSGKHVFRCTASHRIRDISYNVSTEVTVRVVAGLKDHTAPSLPGPGSSDDGLSGYVQLAIVTAVPVVIFFVVVVVSVAVVVNRRRAKPPDRPNDTDVEYQATQSYALQAATAEAPDPSAAGSRRRALPLPTVDESDVPQHAYEDVDNMEDDRATTESPADDEPPTFDDLPGNDVVMPDGQVRLRSETIVDTTPKSIYEPLALELHSSPVQTVSEEANKYARIHDVDSPTSTSLHDKDISVVSLCCRDDVTPIVCGENAKGAAQ